ncbi:hypothetical protein ACVOMS_06835 [Bradyrhizobium guangxiense]
MIPNRKMSATAKILLTWWILVLIFGAFGNLYIAAIAFNSGKFAPMIAFGALAVGCVVLLCRTFIYRNDFRI